MTGRRLAYFGIWSRNLRRKEKKMSKHTTGPWKVLRPTGDIGGQDHNWHVTDAEDTFVAHVFGFNHAIDDQSEANARLIAAAPQMLEALEACAAYWYYKRSPSIPEQSELISLGAEQAQRLIKAAIVAAKGEI
jgi:hypothetical protein